MNWTEIRAAIKRGAIRWLAYANLQYTHCLRHDEPYKLEDDLDFRFRKGCKKCKVVRSLIKSTKYVKKGQRKLQHIERLKEIKKYEDGLLERRAAEKAAAERA